MCWGRSKQRRFSRRTWAVVFTLVTGSAAPRPSCSSGGWRLLPAFFFLSNLGAYLVAAACGGWFGELVPRDQQGALGAWFAALKSPRAASPGHRHPDLPRPARAVGRAALRLSLLALPAPARHPLPARRRAAGARGRARLRQGRQPGGPPADRALDPAPVHLAGDGVRPDQFAVGLRRRSSTPARRWPG